MKIRILAALAAAIAAGPALASDSCASPTPVGGTITVPFNLTNATLDAPGINQCAGNPVGFTMDTWFCWTSDVTGTVTIATCGLTDLDTGIAIYPANLGCACPGDLPPSCCNDDAGGNCGKQSKVTCDVECGRSYMVQLAARPNGAVPAGQIRFDSQGQPCGGNNEPVSCDCCGGRPPIVDTLSTPFDPGLVAAATNYKPFGTGAALYLVDLGGQGSAPVGSNWNTDRYTHPQWTMQKLGGIFGVTLDGAGDIYVAHTCVYPDYSGAGDPVGFGGAGAIYRINGTTGNPALLIKLPQQVDPSLPANQQYPGLGQLTWNCAKDRLYASNFEDGRIYCIDPADLSGFKVRSTYRHGGTTTSALPDANLADPNDAPGFESLGKRIWAVKVAGSRLYYSTWARDQGRPMGGPNQIWSVALDASGNFIANSQQLEFDVPVRAGGMYSNPVADITFDANCCMLIAERSMSDDTNTNAHDARVMRFCQGADGNWSQDIQFTIGVFSGENSTGGVGYETGGADQVWAMSDAISYPGPTDVPPYSAPMVYGLLGQDSVGQPMSASFWVDLDGSFIDNQKLQLGSLEVNCVGPTPCEFNTLDIDCKPNADGTIGFNWTIELVNNSNSPANLLILGDPIFAPNNVIVLNPPLAPGASMVVNVPIPVGVPGDQICFFATLAASYKNECCSEEICIVLPDCSCFEYDANIQDIPGAGNFNVTLNMTNFTSFSNPPGFVGEWVSVAVAPGYTATVTPTLINIPSLPLFASATVGPITVQTSQPAGSTIVLIVGLHSQTFHPCCFIEIPVTVPTQQGSTTPGDVNGDGVVNGADLSAILSGWGLPGASDLNHDGTTNGADLSLVLSNWG